MAGRIPQPFLDELLDRADIVDVIDSRVTLKKTGRNFMACCPFHDEKTPSFSVQPEKQFYYCFGCGASGNALGFLMEYERMEFRVAVEQLAGKYGLQIPEESREDTEQSNRKRTLYDVMERCDLFYREQLRTHTDGKEAVTYLKKRGLSVEILQRFGLGFVPDGWDNMLQHFGNDNAVLQLLLDTGMLVHRESSGKKRRVYDRFRHRIMFPIRDSRGRCIAFGGRVLGDAKPKYLNSPETPIYHKGRELYGLYEARQANPHLQRLVVVEGYMDVIALAQHGIDYAVATLGTATSQTHLQRMFRHCEEIVFCFDGDQAGAAAARRALDVSLPCMEDGRQIRFLFLPDGEDPDTLVRAQGETEFEELLDQAQPLSEYLFATAAKDLDTGTADGKAAMSRHALALMAKLPEGAFASIMRSELASRTGLNASAIDQLAQGHLEEPARPAEPASVPESGYSGASPIDAGLSHSEAPPGYDDSEQNGPPAGWEQDEPLSSAYNDRRRPLRSAEPNESMSLVETAIGLLAYKPQLIALVKGFDEFRALDDADTALFIQLMELLKRRPESSTGMVLGYWFGQPEGEKLSELCGQGIELLREGVETLRQQQGHKELNFDADLEQRFEDTLRRLHAQLNQQKLNAVLAQIAALQNNGQALPASLEQELKTLLQLHRDGGEAGALA